MTLIQTFDPENKSSTQEIATYLERNCTVIHMPAYMRPLISQESMSRSAMNPTNQMTTKGVPSITFCLNSCSNGRKTIIQEIKWDIIRKKKQINITGWTFCVLHTASGCVSACDRAHGIGVERNRDSRRATTLPRGPKLTAGEPGLSQQVCVDQNEMVRSCDYSGDRRSCV